MRSKNGDSVTAPHLSGLSPIETNAFYRGVCGEKCWKIVYLRAKNG